MRGLSFVVDGGLYAADVSLIQKIVRNMPVTPVPAAPEAVIGIANLKGRVITVISLYTLLGNKEKRADTGMTNAVVFKPLSGNEDQLGLSIDKPGEIVYIDDDAICPPSLATGEEESFCICGVADVGDRLYRIIDIDSIINKYTDKIKEYGGIDNVSEN